jgi:hypothetical protein
MPATFDFDGFTFPIDAKLKPWEGRPDLLWCLTSEGREVSMFTNRGGLFELHRAVALLQDRVAKLEESHAKTD